MALTVSKKLYHIVEFSYEHELFSDGENLNSKTIDLVFAQENEFSYNWEVKYEVDEQTVQLENWHLEEQRDLFKMALDDIEDPSPSDHSYPSVDDLTVCEILPSAKINQIEITWKNQLDGDFAYVTILTRKRTLVSNLLFGGSYGPTNSIISIPSTRDEHNYSAIKIIVVVHHRLNVNGLEIINDITKFSENQSLCDVTFVVEKTEIKAHKQILSARNVVFRAMFEADMIEKQNGRVQITDIEPFIFKLLIHFIYSAEVEDSLTHENWFKLASAANKYSMATLLNICEFKISNNLTVNNVLDIFYNADSINAKNLKENCKKFIHDKKSVIVSSDAYSNFIKSVDADLISELFCYEA